MLSLRKDARQPISVAELRQLLRYDPATGDLFWLRTVGQRGAAGSRAGTVHSSGYVVLRYLGREYKAHRVAWALMTGAWPETEIDHRDRDRGNNAWGNLRLATHSENKVNSIVRRSKDLPRGVHPSGSRFMARIGHDGRDIHLGCFATAEEASSARQRAEVSLYGEFRSMAP